MPDAADAANLTKAKAMLAVAQLTHSDTFDRKNPHLSEAQILAIRRGEWPDLPVFSPYAQTKSGYSQSK